MDKRRDTIMLVLQFYIKNGYTHTQKKKNKKERKKNGGTKPITM